LKRAPHALQASVPVPPWVLEQDGSLPSVPELASVPGPVGFLP
jgi:hypothetical protein